MFEVTKEEYKKYKKEYKKTYIGKRYDIISGITYFLAFIGIDIFFWSLDIIGNAKTMEDSRTGYAATTIGGFLIIFSIIFAVSLYIYDNKLLKEYIEKKK